MAYPVTSTLNHFFAQPFDSARVEAWNGEYDFKKVAMFHDVLVSFVDGRIEIDSKNGEKIASFRAGEKIEIGEVGMTITSDKLTKIGLFIQLV